MIFFIDFLRALAMALITNSHYVGVYPTDLIANGGLLGDVIFFAVSGFCLCNIKLPFHKWYPKRIMRIYPIAWVITLFYWALGEYSFESFADFFKGFIYPTQYHFIGSIILLYIPFYIVAYLEKRKGEKFKGKFDFTAIVFLSVAAVWLLVYLFIYDKSYYHIDVVREPMVRFLYFEAMMIGFYIRKHLELFENKKGILKWLITVVAFAVYFASKLLFSKKNGISEFQILNQYILLILMTGIFLCTASLSGFLEKMPKRIKSIISYFAKITLEIYVVQSVIISHFKFFAFPLNWFVITAIIVAAATVLHYLIESPKAVKKQISTRKKQ